MKREIDKIAMLAELHNSVCELDHIGDRSRPAANWLGVPVGPAGAELYIPICEDCASELDKRGASEYLLFYCLACCSSRWAFKPNLKKEYSDSIEFLFACPNCSNKHKGISHESVQ